MKRVCSLLSPVLRSSPGTVTFQIAAWGMTFLVSRPLNRHQGACAQVCTSPDFLRHTVERACVSTPHAGPDGRRKWLMPFNVDSESIETYMVRLAGEAKFIA